MNAWGITLSNEQEQETKRRIETGGLRDKVGVCLADYRNFAREGHTFDKIVLD